MKKAILLAAVFLLAGACGADARMMPPPDMPAELRETEPHRPEAAKYYLAELVREGKMTQQEADDTLEYMIFRDKRRQADLEEVKDMDKVTHRAVMANKRKQRGNPLVEYAEACHLTPERAEELMNYMHGSDKGTKYYKRMEK